MLFYLFIRNFHIMVQSQQFYFRVDAANNGRGAFAVMIGNVVDA